jgi:branched-chain amino acid transport system ATP-binding protein
LVEQNARLALSISKRAYVMELGSIVLKGASEELNRSEHVRKAYLGMY